MRLVLISISVVAAAWHSTPAASANLTAEMAQAIAAGCARHAAGSRQSHAIAVVDTGGHLVAALRMDHTGSGMMDFAIAKAEAVAAWGFPTADMEAGARDVPGFARAPHVVTVAGGVPIFSADGSERLGAAGASGEAPQDDARCVIAGIQAAGLRSERRP